MIGEIVADNVFKLDNGQILSVRDLRGQVVVLNYWGTDCRACDEQIKTLDYYYRQRKDVGLLVLVASIDDVNKTTLRKMVAGTELHAVRSVRGELADFGAIPSTYIIDRNGKVRYSADGVLDITQLNAVLVPLLRQPQPKDM